MEERKDIRSKFSRYTLGDNIVVNNTMWRDNGNLIEKEVLQTSPKWNNYDKYDLDSEKPMLLTDQKLLNDIDYSKCFNVVYKDGKGFTLEPNEEFDNYYDQLESIIGCPLLIVIGQTIKEKFEEKASTINRSTVNSEVLTNMILDQIAHECYINVELFIDCVRFNNDGEELCDYYIKSRILYEIK